MIIPEGYVLEKFFMHCKRPVYKRTAGVYNAECPYCHEGKSSGRKRRFFYLPSEEKLFCQNGCGGKNPLQFIREVTGMSNAEIMREAEEYITPIADLIKRSEKEEIVNKKENKQSLPKDSINLFDHRQVAYYKDDQVVKDALELIKRRRLDTAINKPRALWISLTDEIHRNRLCFPFYDYSSKYDISYYQTRAMYIQDERDGRKYLSKINADKTVFNIQNISPDIDHIFFQEGPIDSMFIRNGVGIAGVYLSELQRDLLTRNFPLHQHVYMFDNQWIDETARKHTEKAIKEGHTVFVWPKHLRKFKDLNELCVDQGINEVPVNYILRYVYSGLNATLQLQQVQTYPR